MTSARGDSARRTDRVPDSDNGIHEDPGAGRATASSGTTRLALGASTQPRNAVDQVKELCHLWKPGTEFQLAGGRSWVAAGTTGLGSRGNCGHSDGEPVRNNDATDC